MAYMLQFEIVCIFFQIHLYIQFQISNWLKCYPQNFCGVGSIYEVIILCLNLKPDDGCLPCNMPELFNKTGNGLADIVIAWDEFKPVLQPEYFWE